MTGYLPKQALAVLSFHGCPVARLGEKDTGGMNTYVLQLAKELGRRGNVVDVYTRYHDRQDPQIVELGPNARVIHLSAGPLDETKEGLFPHIPEFLSNLYRFQRSEGLSYDLVHSHYWLSGRIGLVLSERWGVPHVATFHTLAKTKLQARAGERETPERVAVETRVLDEADAIVVSTEAEKAALSRLYRTPPHKVTVIPAGVDLDLFRPLDMAGARRDLGLAESKVVLYVGRIEPLKGLDILIRAMGLLEHGRDVRLLVVGGSPGRDRELDRLRCLVSELGLGENVTFTGAVKQSELPKYYGAADAFVLPSYYESFGLVALEAMACGTPVIVSRVGGLSSFVKNGETGYLIPWRCPEPFAQRLDLLLANPGLRDTMGRAARLAAERMGWDRVTDGMTEFYSRLVGRAWVSAAGA
jgi:D-inositol-3-phosphate glycosyltransferase